MTAVASAGAAGVASGLNLCDLTRMSPAGRRRTGQKARAEQASRKAAREPAARGMGRDERAPRQHARAAGNAQTRERGRVAGGRGAARARRRRRGAAAAR